MTAPTGPEQRLIAESVAALRHLVDECEAVLNRLGALPEKDLEAWLYNCWYTALIEARVAIEQADE